MTASRSEQIAALTAAFNKITVGLEDRVRGVIGESADRMVGLAQAAAPISELDAHPGALRESIHKIDGGDPLKAMVTADARDEKGHYYAAHVELGHKTPEGKPVPAHPFFWPSYRLVKRDFKSRLRQALKDTLATVKAPSGESDG